MFQAKTKHTQQRIRNHARSECIKEAIHNYKSNVSPEDYKAFLYQLLTKDLPDEKNDSNLKRFKDTVKNLIDENDDGTTLFNTIVHRAATEMAQNFYAPYIRLKPTQITLSDLHKLNRDELHIVRLILEHYRQVPSLRVNFVPTNMETCQKALQDHVDQILQRHFNNMTLRQSCVASDVHRIVNQVLDKTLASLKYEPLLLEIIQTKDFQALDVSHQPLHVLFPRLLEVLMTRLTKNPYMKTLDLTGCQLHQFSQEHWQALARALEHSSIIKLNVTNARIEVLNDNAWQHFCEFLKQAGVQELTYQGDQTQLELTQPRLDTLEAILKDNILKAKYASSGYLFNGLKNTFSRYAVKFSNLFSHTEPKLIHEEDKTLLSVTIQPDSLLR